MNKRPDGYSMAARTNERAVIYLYSDIGGYFDGVTAKQFAKDLNDLGAVREINLRINSVGGSVFEGFAIYNLLSQHPATISVDVDGIAASIASVIAMAAAPGALRMAANATMMVHRPWSMAVGDAETMRKEADLLDKLDGQIRGTYVRRTGAEPAAVAAMMLAETWMDAEEAVTAGFADTVTAEQAIAAHIDPARYGFNKTPVRLVAPPVPAGSHGLRERSPVLLRMAQRLRRRGL